MRLDVCRTAERDIEVLNVADVDIVMRAVARAFRTKSAAVIIWR